MPSRRSTTRHRPVDDRAWHDSPCHAVWPVTSPVSNTHQLSAISAEPSGQAVRNAPPSTEGSPRQDRPNPRMLSSRLRRLQDAGRAAFYRRSKTVWLPDRHRAVARNSRPVLASVTATKTTLRPASLTAHKRRKLELAAGARPSRTVAGPTTTTSASSYATKRKNS